MNTPIRLCQHDSGLKLTFYCRDEGGAPIDLTSLSVDFTMSDGETQLNAGRTLCTKPDAPMGVAEYTITADDTASPGIYQGKLSISDGASVKRSIGGVPVEIESAI
ncbi:phage baseplate upper protein [bacterium]|nr:phage baseplate upper protein [bacterium]